MGITGLRKFWQSMSVMVAGAPVPCDHLYIDLPGHIHIAAGRTGKGTVEAETRKAVRELRNALKRDLRTHRPRKSITLAFDGAAPLAKAMEQRKRRLKDAAKDARTTGRKDAIPRATVTPGTPFMRAMEDAVMEFAQQTLERSPHLEIVVSGCSVPGEAEVKVMSAVRARPPWERHVVVTGDSDATVMLLCMPSVCNVHIADGTRLFSNFNVSSWVMDNWQLTCGEFGVCSEAASDIETAPRKRDHGMGRGRLAGTPPGSGGAAEVAPAALLGARARGLLLAAPWPAGLPALPRMLRLRALPGAARCRAVALSDAAAEPAAAAQQQQHDRPAQADPSKGKQAKPQGNKAKKAPGGGGNAKAKSAHGRKQVQARKRKAGPESKRKQANAGTKAQAASKTTGKPTKATSERAGRGPGIVSGLRRLDLAGAKRNMLKNFQSNAYAGQKQLFNAVRRDVAFVIVLRSGNDYLSGSMGGALQATALKKYFELRALPRWRRRTLLVEDRKHHALALDVQFLAALFMSQVHGDPRAALRGGIVGNTWGDFTGLWSHSGAADAAVPSGDGSADGAAEAKAAAAVVAMGGAAARETLPQALRAGALLQQSTDPRLVALAAWAASNGVTGAALDAVAEFAVRRLETLAGPFAPAHFAGLRACFEMYAASTTFSFRWAPSPTHSDASRGALYRFLLAACARHALESDCGDAQRAALTQLLGCLEHGNVDAISPKALQALLKGLGDGDALLYAPAYGNEAALRGEWFAVAARTDGHWNTQYASRAPHARAPATAAWLHHGAPLLALNARLAEHAAGVLFALPGAHAFEPHVGADGRPVLSEGARETIAAAMAAPAAGAGARAPPVAPPATAAIAASLVPPSLRAALEAELAAELDRVDSCAPAPGTPHPAAIAGASIPHWPLALVTYTAAGGCAVCTDLEVAVHRRVHAVNTATHCLRAALRSVITVANAARALGAEECSTGWSGDVAWARTYRGPRAGPLEATFRAAYADADLRLLPPSLQGGKADVAAAAPALQGAAACQRRSGVQLLATAMLAAAARPAPGLWPHIEVNLAAAKSCLDAAAPPGGNGLVARGANVGDAEPDRAWNSLVQTARVLALRVAKKLPESRGPAVAHKDACQAACDAVLAARLTHKLMTHQMHHECKLQQAEGAAAAVASGAAADAHALPLAVLMRQRRDDPAAEPPAADGAAWLDWARGFEAQGHACVLDAARGGSGAAPAHDVAARRALAGNLTQWELVPDRAPQGRCEQLRVVDLQARVLRAGAAAGRRGGLRRRQMPRVFAGARARARGGACKL